MSSSAEVQPIEVVRLPVIVHTPMAGVLPDGRYGLRLGDVTLNLTRKQWDDLYQDAIDAFDAADDHAWLMEGLMPKGGAA